MARRRVERSYPGGVISLVSHELPSGEVVVCGYAGPRGAPTPNAFVWRRGHLMSPTEVAAIAEDRLASLCGPDYVPPIKVTPPS